MRSNFAPIIIVLAVLVAAGYFLLSEPVPTSSDSTPTAIESDDKAEISIASDHKLNKEAEQYLDDITDKNNTSLDVDTVNDFVTKDQTLSLADTKEIETLSVDELYESGIKGSAPITLLKKQQQIIYKTPNDILFDAKGDHSKTVKYLENGEIIEITVGELLEQYPLDTIENIAVVVEVDNYIITTPDELRNDASISSSEPLKIIRKPYRLPTTSIGELLMGDSDLSGDDIFYVRNIDDTDQNGIWGVVQDGLLKNFARGIAIKRGENLEKYQVIIPQDADEALADNTSSFLGKLIYKKSQESYVYNFEKGKMGRNPDLIYPGQEIVIIQFTPDELINIYKHFVNNTQS